MEVLISEPIDLERMADLCACAGAHKPPTPRDKSKWHVSNLLHSQAIVRGSNGLLYAVHGPEIIRYYEFEGHPSGIMSLGRIWETAVDCYLSWWASNREGLYSPDHELASDGILGSLDGLMFLPGFDAALVCETKLRFTLNCDIPLSHLQQIRAYCHLLSTDLACYVVGHLSSNPPTAAAELKVIRFSMSSIEETWQEIVNTKLYLESQGVHPYGGQ